MASTNSSTGADQIASGADLKALKIKGDKATAAAVDAAAEIIDSGDLGDGPFGVQISRVAGPTSTLTLTVNGYNRPA